MSYLEPLFKPKSIAIVGASRTPGKIGYEILKNLIEYGYSGKLYPVNPKAKEILGLKCYPKVSAIPDKVDVVIVVVPAKIVPEVLEDSGKAGAKFAVIITAGFKEVGNVELENRVVKIARKYGIRILGPNIFGYVYTPLRINATFGPKDVIPGGVAFITQSGALGIALMGMTILERIGVSTILSVGNKADLEDSELIEYLATDPSTKVILIYLEALVNGRRFVEMAQKVTLHKPIIVIKAGRTEVGAKAASSHTGALAGDVALYKAALTQAGVLIASNVEEAFDWARAFSLLPLPEDKGNVLLITNGGGAGVLATDTLAEYGVYLKPTPKDLVEELRKITPPFAALGNPVDLSGQIDEVGYVEALGKALQHPEVSGVLALYCHTGFTDPPYLASLIIKKIKEIGGLKKPLTVAFIGGEEVSLAIRRLTLAGIPTYPTPERAASALAALYRYIRVKEEIKAKLGIK